MLRALLLIILLTVCEAVQGSSGSSAPPRETPVVESTSAPSGAQAVSVTYRSLDGVEQPAAFSRLLGHLP